MTPNDNWLEITAATVETAISEGLQKLDASESEVVIEVLNLPRAGLLGLGARQAKVRLRRKQAESARHDAPAPQADGSRTHPAARSDEDEAGERQAAGGRENDENAPARESATPEEQSREAVAMLNQILSLMGEKTA